MNVCCFKSNTVKMNSKIKLEDCDESIKKFTLNGLTTHAKCVKVYDGDSVHIVMLYNGSYNKFACRLIGINADELRGTNVTSAKLARDYLRNLVHEKVVDVKCHDFDKYGRLLVELTLNGVNINKKMVDDGYAHPYVL